MERIWQSDQHRFSIPFEIDLNFEIIIARESFPVKTVLCEAFKKLFSKRRELSKECRKFLLRTS